MDPPWSNPWVWSKCGSVLLSWKNEDGFHPANPDAIAIDGKTLKGAKDADGRQLHLMAAILHKEGVVVSQRPVDKKTNEITEFQSLLDPLDLKDKVITADALHTQVEHAKYLKEQKKADYFFTVKGNQKTLLHAIEDLDDGDFSP